MAACNDASSLSSDSTLALRLIVSDDTEFDIYVIQEPRYLGRIDSGCIWKLMQVHFRMN